MTKEQIDEMISKPCEKLKRTYSEDGLYFTEISVYSKALGNIKLNLECSNKPEMDINGSVDINIDIPKLTQEQRAGFGFLEVPARIQRRGIGTGLMLKVLEIVKDFKGYYGIDKEVKVSGWLSHSDCENGNWATSVPLYERVGKIANVKTVFLIRNTETEEATADDFLKKVGSSYGDVVYFI